MTQITCPKCQHARQPQETAPEWQCPACGVAYAKVANRLAPSAPPPLRETAMRDPEARDIPWGKLILFFAFAIVVAISLQSSRNKARAIDGEMAHAPPSARTMSALAASVGPDDVVMYSTTECGYCTLAKNWLSRHGFAFTECNMSLESHCETEFRKMGGHGTPFLVIYRRDKTYFMRRGFDSDEFLALLAK